MFGGVNMKEDFEYTIKLKVEYGKGKYLEKLAETFCKGTSLSG